MAITKIKPIRGTVNKALAYILDPQKTDDQLYVASYGCAASDAAAKEFEWTRNLAAQQGMQMPKVIARHLIQSFAIDEVTPEQAHEIGKQFADEWLKGKYEYVIATHIDKGHCHNHIIFNAVNYVDFHAYRSNKKTYREMRHLSDEICAEHGLSVIPPSQGKGMDYKEWHRLPVVCAGLQYCRSLSYRHPHETSASTRLYGIGLYFAVFSSANSYQGITKAFHLLNESAILFVREAKGSTFICRTSPPSKFCSVGTFLFSYP